MADSPRWCAHCNSYGDHHTDRHPLPNTPGAKGPSEELVKRCADKVADWYDDGDADRHSGVAGDVLDAAIDSGELVPASALADRERENERLHTEIKRLRLALEEIQESSTDPCARQRAGRTLSPEHEGRE